MALGQGLVFCGGAVVRILSGAAFATNRDSGAHPRDTKGDTNFCRTSALTK